MKIFHLQSKVSGRNFYYRTLTALVADWDYEKLGVSKSTLDRYEFEANSGRYENELIVIQKGLVQGTREIELKSIVDLIFKSGIDVSINREGIVKARGHVIEYKKGFILDGKEMSKKQIIAFLSKKS